ncbi:MAG: carbohydrate kinase family protein [Promethearchaeota archaeon]
MEISIEKKRKTPKIVLLGPLNIDMIIHGSAPTDYNKLNEWSGESEVSILTAGAIGYTTKILKKLGNEPLVISEIGQDRLSHVILDELHALGINTKFIQVKKGKITAVAIFMLLFGSIKRPLTFRLPTHDLWPLENNDKHLHAIKDADWFHQGGFLHFQQAWNNGSVLELFKVARKHGVPTSMDPQFPLFDYPRPWVGAMEEILPFVDYLFVDKNEACSLMDTKNHEVAARELLDLGVGHVVVKLAEHGSILLAPDEIFRQDAELVEYVVDSIGAGDSFNAGFIDSVLQGFPPRECLEHATRIASLTLNYSGGQFIDEMKDH